MYFQKPGERNKSIMRSHLRSLLVGADKTTKYYKYLYTYYRQLLKGVIPLEKFVRLPHV